VIDLPWLPHATRNPAMAPIPMRRIDLKRRE